MNEEEFLKKLVEIMDTETSLTMDTKLEDVEEWDSLSYVTFLTMCKSMQKKVLPDDIITARTLRDLYRLISETA